MKFYTGYVTKKKGFFFFFQMDLYKRPFDLFKCLGEFVLNLYGHVHQIPVRTGEGRAVDVPVFLDVIFKTKAPTMTYRAPNEDCEVVYPSKHDTSRDLREQQLSDAKKGKPEIVSIKKTHVATKYIDERGLKGYRVGALLQHVKGKAKKSKKVDIEHMHARVAPRLW